MFVEILSCITFLMFVGVIVSIFYYQKCEPFNFDHKIYMISLNNEVIRNDLSKDLDSLKNEKIQKIVEVMDWNVFKIDYKEFLGSNHKKEGFRNKNSKLLNVYKRCIVDYRPNHQMIDIFIEKNGQQVYRLLPKKTIN